MSQQNQILTEKAVIVNLRISNWTGRKYDKKVSDEIEQQKDAHDAGRYNKALVAPSRLKPITTLIGKARTFHYDNTLPWGDNGDRLLPSANYLSYMGELATIKNEFDAKVRDFIKAYDEAILDAQIRLKDMFDHRDYPTRSELESKYGIKTVVLPVPETDFRVNLSDAEIDKLKEDMTTEITDRLNDAMKDVWARIKKQLTHMQDRLTTEIQEGSRAGYFKDSLFENLAELVDVLPRLNVTGDENINKICADMKNLLVDPNSVRNSDTLRAAKAQEVESIINKFSAFF